MHTHNLTLYVGVLSGSLRVFSRTSSSLPTLFLRPFATASWAT